MSKKTTGDKNTEAQPDFEAALGELESLVEALESGDLSLADSLEHFKRGVGLSKRCHQLIDEARQSVELLSNPESEASSEPFEATER